MHRSRVESSATGPGATIAHRAASGHRFPPLTLTFEVVVLPRHKQLYPLILRGGHRPRLEGCGPGGGLMVRDGASRLLTMRV